MNQEYWNKSSAKKLFDCFMDIERNQYPEHFHKDLKKREELVEKFILEFGVNHITINNYTNMMQFSSSITIDVFDSKRWNEGSIVIDIGSEPEELWATRENKNIRFDFENWRWK